MPPAESSLQMAPGSACGGGVTRWHGYPVHDRPALDDTRRALGVLFGPGQPRSTPGHRDPADRRSRRYDRAPGAVYTEAVPASWWEPRYVSWEHVGPDLEGFRSGPAPSNDHNSPVSRRGNDESARAGHVLLEPVNERQPERVAAGPVRRSAAIS